MLENIAGSKNSIVLPASWNSQTWSFIFSLCFHPHLLSSSSHSDAQLHSAWPKEKSHLEHNHVDIPLLGSGSHYLFVLPWVVCPALLPPEGGNTLSISLSNRKNTMYFFLYGYGVIHLKVGCFWFICLKCRHNFSFIWWCFCFSLPS